MKLILLDRDGVINHDSDDYIKCPDEWHPIDGSPETIGKLKSLGYKIAVITNQSGIARGLYTERDLNAIHAKLQQTLAVHGGGVDAIFFCPHGPDDGCNCRKPKTGLLEQAQEYFGLESLAGVPFIGDSLRDIQAGQAMDCRPMLVRTGYGTGMLEKNANALADVPNFANLQQAIEHYLAEQND